MKKRTGCFLIGSLLFLLLLCGGVGAWLYLSSRSQGTRAFVMIRSPQSGQLAEVNETLPLEVYAEAGRPVLRLEVYADGALVAAANGNNRSLSLSQLWTATTPGRHALVARAFFATDDFADSPVVFVDIADLSDVPVSVNVDDLPRGEGVTEVRVGDLASAAGTTPEELARLNPGLPAAPDAVIPPGTPILLPRHPNPPPILPPPPVPPPAPGAPGMDPAVPPPSRFEGETHSCSQISIRWTDSPDETSYRLYRIAPGERSMSRIATLPANTLTYTDAVTGAGTYRYFLAPVRPGGESIASMLSVEIGPECAPAERGATTSLNLLLLSLTTQEAYDGVYCYVSFNGSRYERLPAEPGLLRPTSPDRLNYELPLQLPSRGVYPITVPSDGWVRLEGECWGRRGAESLRIGRFSGRHARGEWDGRDLGSELVALEPRPLASTQGVPPGAAGASSLNYRIRPVNTRLDPAGMPGMLRLIPNIPVLLDPIERDNPTIPSPTNLRISDMLVSPVLRWDWSGNAAYTEADITGWRIDVSIYDAPGPGQASGTLTYRVPRSRNPAGGYMAPIPALRDRCIGAHITVTALTNDGESLPSAPVDRPRSSSPLSFCPETRRGHVRVTIESLTVRPSGRTGQVLDDGDICIGCADRRLELYRSPTDMLQVFARLVVRAMYLPVEIFGFCPVGTRCVTAGDYGIPGEVVIPISSSGELHFMLCLLDQDVLNLSDPFICRSIDMLRSPEEWLRTDERVTVTGDFGEAMGEIVIRIQGLP
ncbi:MAG TPA: hypothetical protein VNK89_02510 [Thermoflexus sp.]|nr:hypothetical protein [Thermoflexus sp.]